MCSPCLLISDTSLQDNRYLKPHVEEVIKENEERSVWDTMTVERK